MNISSKSLEVHQLCEVCFTVCQIKTTTEQRVMEFNQGRTKEDHRRKITLILHHYRGNLNIFPLKIIFFLTWSLTFSSFPLFYVCFPLTSLPLVANSASIFSSSLPLFLPLLHGKIPPPFSVSFLLFFPLLASTVSPSFSISFLLCFTLLVSEVSPPLSSSFSLFFSLSFACLAPAFSFSLSFSFSIIQIC